MFSILCEEYEGVIILSFNGEFYIESTEYAEKTWRDQMAKTPGVIGINCINIKFIDSSAIGLLVKFLHSGTKRNAKLVLFDLSEAVLTALDTSRLGNIFTIMTGPHFEQSYLKGAIKN